MVGKAVSRDFVIRSPGLASIEEHRRALTFGMLAAADNPSSGQSEHYDLQDEDQVPVGDSRQTSPAP